MGEVVREVVATAPINIAVIKYWGKRDEQLIIPLNSSISVTLSQSQLKTTTKITLKTNSSSGSSDSLRLNDKEDVVTKRIKDCFQELRELYVKQKGEEARRILRNTHLVVESWNNFPTASGMASSASGLSCLVFACAALFDIQGDVSHIARRGSGSACRSLYGGFVKWEAGHEDDGSDSRAIQLFDQSHWPALRILILIVDDRKKTTSSTSGMETSKKTSQLLDYRVKQVLPQRIPQMETAIATRNFPAFAEITMKDSNQFHAICRDTYPPIEYLNDTSREIISLIHRINSTRAQPIAAYTFDAGPNAFIFCLEQDQLELLHHIQKALILDEKELTDQSSRKLIAEAKCVTPSWGESGFGFGKKKSAEEIQLKNILCCHVGSDPVLVSKSEPHKL